jgi:hypothetical protein
MALSGLCATGNMRSADDMHKIIDAEDIKVSDLFSTLAYVDAVDVRHHISEWSTKPQPNHLNGVIVTKLRSGQVPGRNITWKEFCDDVRNASNGWRAKGQAAWGFSDKQIQRKVRYLRDFSDI